MEKKVKKDKDIINEIDAQIKGNFFWNWFFLIFLFKSYF